MAFSARILLDHRAPLAAGASRRVSAVGQMHTRRIALLIATALFIALDAVCAVLGFTEPADYGVTMLPTGKVIALETGGPGRMAGVAIGDLLFPAPAKGDAVAGFRAGVAPRSDESLHIRTVRGVVAVAPVRSPMADSSTQRSTWPPVRCSWHVQRSCTFAGRVRWRSRCGYMQSARSSPARRSSAYLPFCRMLLHSCLRACSSASRCSRSAFR